MKTFIAVLLTIIMVAGTREVFNPRSNSPEILARKADAALDKEKLLEITEYDLVHRWPQEVAPFFEYEMLTNGEAKAPKVELFKASDCVRYFHVLGYTFGFDTSGDVYLNERFGNRISPRFGSITALTTLVHETAHIQGGEFKASEDCEKLAQLATLEVLAAMANSGNKYARQALLDELRDIYVGVACLAAIKSGNFEDYYRLSKSLFGDERARKSIRQWQQRGMSKLVEILTKYDASVYEDMQDFQFIAKAEGDNSPRVFLLDDLEVFIKTL